MENHHPIIRILNIIMDGNVRDLLITYLMKYLKMETLGVMMRISIIYQILKVLMK